MNSFSQFSTNPSSTTQKLARSTSLYRQQLEKLWSTSIPAKPTTPWIKQLGQWLLKAMTDSEQVRVWTKITPSGLEWHAYDPERRRSFASYSEADLRTWLEQRYQA